MKFLRHKKMTQNIYLLFKIKWKYTSQNKPQANNFVKLCQPLFTTKAPFILIRNQ